MNWSYSRCNTWDAVSLFFPCLLEVGWALAAAGESCVAIPLGRQQQLMRRPQVRRVHLYSTYTHCARRARR